jgi:D-alanyl-lipoteichoic acid acyltransferase DltB (MBOAT superfamily)
MAVLAANSVLVSDTTSTDALARATCLERDFLVVLVSPFVGKLAEKAVEVFPVDYVIDWPFLFLQLFAAFWGQSLIAEHTSRFFGLPLPVNFDQPWKARTIKDFWARWHRSMAQFVLQYIFLPLNLKGVSPKIATVCAFVFMGVWHNLSLGYFVWGVAHGTLLAFDRDVSKNRIVRLCNQIVLWIIVISLSWFANYGPWS